MKEKKEGILEFIEEPFRVKNDILPQIMTPLHHHPHYELVWIKESSGIRIVGDHIGRFTAGDMVLLPPYLPHVWKNDKPSLGIKTKADVFVIHFHEDFISRLLSVKELSDIRSILQQSLRGMQILGETNKQISQTIQQLYHAYTIERIRLFLKIFQILLNKNQQDIHFLASEHFSRFVNAQEDERLRKIIEYIGIHFTENISIKEISDVACMSPTAFCRYFKQKTQFSFIPYLNRFRLDYAKILLENNQYKISTVADMAGFQDVSYFNRVFRKEEGMTPSDYITTRWQKKDI